jgi:hypothetical protein
MADNEEIGPAPTRTTKAITGTNPEEVDIEKGNSNDETRHETGNNNGVIVLDIASGGIKCPAVVIPVVEASSCAELPRLGENSIRILLMDEVAGETKVSRIPDTVTQAIQDYEKVKLNLLHTKRDKVFDLWALESTWSPGIHRERIRKPFLVQSNIPLTAAILLGGGGGYYHIPKGITTDWSTCAAYLSWQRLRFGPQTWQAHAFLECMIAVQSEMMEEKAIQSKQPIPHFGHEKGI